MEIGDIVKGSDAYEITNQNAIMRITAIYNNVDDDDDLCTVEIVDHTDNEYREYIGNCFDVNIAFLIPFDEYDENTIYDEEESILPEENQADLDCLYSKAGIRDDAPKAKNTYARDRVLVILGII